MGTTWSVFAYHVHQYPAVSCLKVRQVDGTLKAVTMHGTAHVNSVTSDGAIETSEVQQVVKVLNFEFGSSVELFSKWTGFSAKEWKFYIGDKSFKQGIFAKKCNVSGPRIVSRLSAH